MNLLKGSMIAALAIGTAALPSFAQDRKDLVKSIDVTVDIAAVQNAPAAQYWGSLEKDLETAILTRVAERTAKEGAEITVDIDEVSLSSGFAEAAGLADTRLQGLVKVSDPTQPGRGDSYDLTVDVNAVLPVLGADYDIKAPGADTSVMYRAMVETYADQVVKNLK